MKKLITALSIGTAILFGGCAIKGSPSLWAARIADSTNANLPKKFTINMGSFNAELSIYRATNLGTTLYLDATTNAYNTIVAELEEGYDKQMHREVCNSYPTGQLIEKGLIVVYELSEKEYEKPSIYIEFNKEECQKRGFYN